MSFGHWSLNLADDRWTTMGNCDGTCVQIDQRGSSHDFAGGLAERCRAWDCRHPGLWRALFCWELHLLSLAPNPKSRPEPGRCPSRPKSRPLSRSHAAHRAGQRKAPRPQATLDGDRAPWPRTMHWQPSHWCDGLRFERRLVRRAVGLRSLALLGVKTRWGGRPLDGAHGQSAGAGMAVPGRCLSGAPSGCHGGGWHLLRPRSDSATAPIRRCVRQGRWDRPSFERPR